ncbi:MULTISPECIES: DUF3500 domain-containing protein [unclassified Paraburkholderia]|uniref:DUF3500 domain-containing protein n=1 Tax=unclassified Paraburkholderia TaxID=2615204 RepID=UPI002AAF3311|nr:MULTISPECIES: DUF3500 domain-containing protein [unclassified Paraburkholderia]
MNACGGGGSSDESSSDSTSSSSSTSSDSTTSTTSATTNLVGAGASEGSGTSAVVAAAETFLTTLSDTQKAVATSTSSTSTAVFDLTKDNAIYWTNLPGNRHGLRLNTSTLTTAQLTAAENLMATALSTAGKTEQDEIRRADDVLGTSSSTYGSANYSIAILGTPSTTSAWMLQITGHHLAYNIMYNSTYVSGSPAFIGVEPPNWVVSSSGTISVNGNVTASSSGTQHAPLETQRAAVYNLATTLQANGNYTSSAKLSGTYNDVVAGAVNSADSNYGALAYPTTNRGILYSSLDTTTQSYVRALIEAYVNTMPSDIATSLLSTYESSTALASTYVGYSPGTSGTADFSAFPSGTTTEHSYLRVDGPRVWIEFVVQQGVVYSSEVHYHSVWRDKIADYGGQFGSGSTSF